MMVQMTMKPQNLDTIVATNLHSDFVGALAGSLDVAPTANIDPQRRFPQMLDHLGEAHASARLMRAVEKVTGAGILTPDVGGTATTTKDVSAAIVPAIQSSNVRQSADRRAGALASTTDEPAAKPEVIVDIG
jgi:tartrate dehydrogenase/decarboxylase / D-malate dehydrogenase